MNKLQGGMKSRMLLFHIILSKEKMHLIEIPEKALRKWPLDETAALQTRTKLKPSVDVNPLV